MCGDFRLNDCKIEINSDFKKRAEESLRKKFRKKLYSRFTKALAEYSLISAGDKIAVCISGAKSLLTAKLFQEFKRHNAVCFETVYLAADLSGKIKLTDCCKLLDIPVKVISADTEEDFTRSAEKEGCNKIALSENYDDVIGGIISDMLYGGKMCTAMPKQKTGSSQMQIIRPAFLLREETVKEWLYYVGLPCEILRADGDKLKKAKEIIRLLESEDKGIEQNIFRSAENVSLRTVIAYRDKDGKVHRFTDDY